MSGNPSPTATTDEQHAEKQPTQSRPYWIGGTVSAAIILWGCVAVTHVNQQSARTLMVILGAAITATVVAVQLGLAYVQQRTSTRCTATIVSEVGALAAEVEQHSAKLDRIDPWTIYTAVASDFALGHDRRRD